MGKHRIKPNYRRRVLRLPDLDDCKLAVHNSLGSPASRRVHEYSINYFARLCHTSGGELEQIQFLLGHASVQQRKRLRKKYLR
jgi:hypothetical protein